MADTMVGTSLDFHFVNSLRAVPSMGGSTGNLASTSNYATITNIRGALKTANPTTYTDAVLDMMNTNDMTFALRNVADPRTIADYIVANPPTV